MKNENEVVAIVGIGCRFPGGVVDPTSFVQFLRERGDGIAAVPEDRWSLARYFDPDPSVPGRTYASRGGFLQENIFAFEPEPFGISPREAASFDPQQALLLETAWEALEDAGLSLDGIAGSGAGVYMGLFGVDNHPHRMWGAGLRAMGQHVATAVSHAMVSARLAYTFDLRGPTLTVDTACSSSLVAIHLACRAIRTRECDMALAGGANVMVLPSMMIALAKGHFASADGRSKAFDAAADGYGRGEGAAVVVLKRLSAALADGDRIHGLILGTAVNQDGRTDGITVPSSAAQETLIRSACADAGISPDQVGYVEAHGTGTAVGDPIEVRALAKVYGRESRDCWIGSVKTNIGHLEAAAGVAGAVKASLMLRERRVLPQLGPATVNPALDLSGLQLATEERAWPEARPLAAVNSFGYGGTNAHLILAAPPRTASAAAHGDRPAPVPISAYSEAALRARAGDLARWLEGERVEMRDLRFTLARRRSHLPSRACLLADTPDELRTALAALRDGHDAPEIVRDTAPAGPTSKVAWVFTGMGPQRAGMARELLAEEPVFRRELEACDAVFRGLAGWSMLEVLADPERHGERLRRNDAAQVANFFVQAGLIALLESYGVHPDGVVGHSVGELGAAYAAGVLSREDAVRVVHHRARASQAVAGRGTMLAAGVSAEEAEALIEPGDDVCVAAINGPRAVTLAGHPEALAKVARLLEELGAFQRMLSVEVAYHSAHLDPIRDELLRSWRGVGAHAPRVALYSTVTGRSFAGELQNEDYWWRNLRRPVRFAGAARAMVADGYRIFLEVGPHPVLATYLREVLDEAGVHGRTFHTLKRDARERREVQRAVASLHCAGARVDWSAASPHGRQLSLPVYPWQRAVHWQESAEMRAERLGTDWVHPFLQTRLPAPHPSWTSRLEGAAAAYLWDHRVQGVPIAPAAFYVEAGLALARTLDPDAEALMLRRVRFTAALPLEAGASVCVRAEDGRFEVHGRGAEAAHDGWNMHASGAWARADADLRAEPLAAVQRRLVERVDAAHVYGAMERRGLDYGPAFRALKEIHRGPAEALARLELPELPSQARLGAVLPPPLLDGVFQSMVGFLDGGAMVVGGLGELVLRVARGVGSRCWSHARLIARDARSITAQVTLYADDGEVIGRLDGVRCQLVEAGDPREHAKRWLYAQRWHPIHAAGHRRDGAWALYGGSWLAPRLAEGLRLRAREAAHRPPAAPPDANAAHHAVVLEPGEDIFSELSGVAALAHGLLAGGWRELTVITSGAVQARAGDVVSPEAHACWGFVRALEREVSPLRLRLIDAAPGADLGALVSALDAEGEDEVAVRDAVLYGARLERVDLGSLRARVDPSASCVAWSAEQGWMAVSQRQSPATVRVRVERGVVFPMPGARGGRAFLSMSVVANDTDGRGVVIQSGLPATELGIAPSALWSTETAPTAGQLVVALGRYIARGLLRVPAGGAVWVSPSLPWLAVWLEAAGVPVAADSGAARLAAIVLSEASELAPALLSRCADEGTVGIASTSAGAKLPLDVLPNGWGATRLDVVDALANAPRRLEPWLPAATNALVPELPLEALGEHHGLDPVAFDVSPRPIDALDARALRVTPHDTWWITGGTRGFGLAIAQWLLEQGAKHLILTSLTGHIDGGERARLEALAGAGASIEVAPLDVGDGDAVDAFVAGLRARGREPTGIVHAAARYEIAPASELDRGQFERVFRAKALGAWHLHQATRGLPIAHFILCSSVTALLGNALQTAYAAANAYLDGLAVLRRSQGLAARSVGWGALLDVGILAREEASALDVEASGLRRMRARDAWEVFAAVPPSAPDSIAIFDGDWRQLFPGLRLPARARWGELQPSSRGASEAGLDAILRGVAPARHLEAIDAAIRDCAAAVLRTAADRIDPERPLRDYGIDSLLAVELRVSLGTHLGVGLTTMEILAGASARALALTVLRAHAPVRLSDPSTNGAAS